MKDRWRSPKNGVRNLLRVQTIFSLENAFIKQVSIKRRKRFIRNLNIICRIIPGFFTDRAILSLAEKDTIEANKQIDKLKSAWKEAFSASDAFVIRRLGLLYSEAGMPDRAEKYLRKALSMEPDDLG